MNVLQSPLPFCSGMMGRMILDWRKWSELLSLNIFDHNQKIELIPFFGVCILQMS